MTAKLIKFEKPEGINTIFFNVLFEFENPFGALVVTGFKINDDRIFPPDKPWKGKHYTSVYLSREAALLVQKALVEAGIEGLTLDSDAWVSAKWGQNGLKNAAATDQLALEIWRKYREDQNVKTDQ